MHWHHLKPKHLGGTDHPSNLLEVTVEEHALIHEARWYAYGNWQDKIAWLCLSGQIDQEEAIKLASSHAHKGRKSPEHSKRMKGNDFGKGKKGYHWYTNGFEDTMSDECPPGFRRGRSHEQTAWNKGLTKEDPRVAKNIKNDPKTGRFMKHRKKK